MAWSSMSTAISTRRFAIRVSRVPEGKEIDYMRTVIPTNVGFGRGATSKTLYITALTGLYSVQVKKDGYHLPARR